MCVPPQKAVIGISWVTQPLRALSAEPGCVHSAVLGLPALGTVASSPLGRNGVIVDLHGKVPKRKGTDGGWCTSTSATATILTNQLWCQLEPKILELSSWIHWQCGASSVWRRWWWPRPVRNKKYICKISYFSFGNGSSLLVDPLYPLHPCRYCT